MEVVNTVLYSYSISISFLIVAILSPLLSGIADYGGNKKSFLKFFTLLGSVCSALLFFFNGKNVEFGITCSVLASVGYSGSLVFYNAYLPEITTKDNFDQVSARGYSFGYVGSVLLLVLSFITIEFYEILGFSSELQAVRLSFLLVGVWWLVFAQISFYYLPKTQRSSYPVWKLISKGQQEIMKVVVELRRFRSMKFYLIAFFFYISGVQTIMFLAATFGDKELKIESSKLIATVTVIQLVAIAGAYLFASISKKQGNQRSLLYMLAIWVGVCIAAYFINSEVEFYILATIIGLIMGGIQSMSRSTFSKLIPEGSIDNTSYFSFYDVTEKLAIVVGTFAYGAIEQFTGSMRNSALFLVVFFLAGIVFLLASKINVGRLKHFNS